MLEEASRYGSDHNPLILRVACDALTHAPTPNNSAASGVKMRYDVQKAEAYQTALASLLQQHFIPFIQHELDIDILATKFVACLIAAANSTMPQVCKQTGVHSRKHQAWFDSKCHMLMQFRQSIT